MLVANGQFPGPMIEANWGDWIEVAVTNDLVIEGTSIHWHGFLQVREILFPTDRDHVQIGLTIKRLGRLTWTARPPSRSARLLQGEHSLAYPSSLV